MVDESIKGEVIRKENLPFSFPRTAKGLQIANNVILFAVNVRISVMNDM